MLQLKILYICKQQPLSIQQPLQQPGVRPTIATLMLHTQAQPHLDGTSPSMVNISVLLVQKVINVQLMHNTSQVHAALEFIATEELIQMNRNAQLELTTP